MTPGVLLLWSAGRPVFHAVPLPPEGLVLGRELIEHLGSPGDDTPPAAARVGADLVLHDPTPTTFVHGAPAQPGVLEPPALVRTGGALWMVISDVAPHTPRLRRDGRFVIGATSRPRYEAVLAAARAEVNLMLRGPLRTVSQLAKIYQATIGGSWARFEPKRTPSSLEAVLATQPRGLELVLPDRDILQPTDGTTLATALDAGLRVVTIAEADRPMLEIPKRVLGALSTQTIGLPPVWRFDELPVMAWDVIRALAPAVRIDADAIEYCLRAASRGADAYVLAALDAEVRRWRRPGREVLRADDLGHIQPAEDFLVGTLVGRPPPPSHSQTDVTRLRLPLCTDALCPGELGREGSCVVCGALSN